MFSLPIELFSIFTFLVIFDNANADLTDFQKSKLSEHFISFGVSCITTNPLDYEDIQALRSMTMPKSENAFCFFGCVLKKAGLLGPDGKLSPEAVLDVTNQIFKDKDEKDKVIKVFTSCAHVNDVTLTDDSKGCKRAKLVLSCLIEESDEEDSAQDAVGGNVDKTVTTRDTGIKSGSFHGLIVRLIRTLLRLTCHAISNDSLSGKLLGRFIPGNQLLNLLCGFIRNDG